VKVQVGTKMQERSINLEVDDSDALATFGEEKWNSWNTSKRFKMLSTYADSLIVKYLADNHMISSDMAKTRMHALQEIMNG
jgi:hypothetical protein